MKQRIVIFTVLLSLGCLTGLSVAAPSVDEIISKANNASYYAGDDGRAEVNMIITDKQKRVRKRVMTILRRDIEDGKSQLFFIYFKKPSDVRKTTFLVHKFVDKDDDRWMYLPSLDLVKRIASSDKRTSFVGSNFFYEDISGRNMTDDNHELVEESAKHYIINNTPKSIGSVEFSSYKVWINKVTFLPEKAEYLDKTETLYRLVEVLESTDIGGFPTVTKSKVTDLESGGNTIIEFKKIKYNIGLDESLFTERYLSRPPREARK